MVVRDVLVLAAALAFAPAPASARTLGDITFTPCELDIRAGGTYEAECARYTVPENPAAPQGRRIALQLALVPARARKPEPDPVVFLAGGPGQSALEAYGDVFAALAPLRRNRHILLIDQRGTGKSNPLKCPMPDWKDPAEQTAAAMRRQAAECLAEITSRADPRWYTTGDAVRDLEAVRGALGAPTLNLVATSYGTRVALEFLRRHPEGVRSIVLDSPVPPELPLLQDHARNLDAAIALQFAACRDEPACARRFGDPAETLERLRARLATGSESVRVYHPRTFEPRDDALTETLLAAVIRLYAYQPETAALLPLLLDEAARGRPASLVAQGDLIFERIGDAIAHGMELSVVCSEDEPWLAARPEDAGTLIGTSIILFAQEQCAVWPRGSVAPDFKTPVPSDKPVLLLSGERDPVTPPRYATQIARTLSNSRHLVAAGQGHTVMMRGCLPRLLHAFVESRSPATLESGCLEALRAPPAFTSYQGPEP